MLDKQIKERERQKDLQRLRGFRPIDDDFMRCLFKDNIPLVELVLRTITGKQDLVITDCRTQKDMKRLAGARSICLDAYGTDSLGQKYDLEIQRADRGANPHRARYHSSVMDIENLNAGQEFNELPNTYTIFITEKDFYGKDEPIYHIERINLETGEPFGDGEHILYVNGEYRGDSDLGKLMHDFNCTKAEDMNFRLMVERTRYLKENPKGVEEMCKEIQTFGFPCTYKLLSYPNLFYQTPKLWEYKPLKGLYFLYHFIPQKSTNEPSGFFHFGETFASFSHSNVANAFRSSSVVTSR